MSPTKQSLKPSIAIPIIVATAAVMMATEMSALHRGFAQRTT